MVDYKMNWRAKHEIKRKCGTQSRCRELGNQHGEGDACSLSKFSSWGAQVEVGEGCSVDQLPLLQRSKDGDCVTAGNSPGGNHQIFYWVSWYWAWVDWALLSTTFDKISRKWQGNPYLVHSCWLCKSKTGKEVKTWVFFNFLSSVILVCMEGGQHLKLSALLPWVSRIGLRLSGLCNEHLYPLNNLARPKLRDFDPYIKA